MKKLLIIALSIIAFNSNAQKKLQAYIIGTDTMSIQIKDPAEWDFEGNKPMIYQVVSKSGYAQVPINFKNIRYFRLYNGDHLAMNELTQKYIDDITGGSPSYTNWSLLTAKDKKLAYRYCDGIDSARIIQDFKDDGLTQQEATEKYKVKNAINVSKIAEAYTERLASPVTSYILTKYITEADMIAMFDTISNRLMLLKQTGHIGSEYGEDIPGIMDYVEATGDDTGGGLSVYSYIYGNHTDCKTEFKRFFVNGVRPNEYITYKQE